LIRTLPPTVPAAAAARLRNGQSRRRPFENLRVHMIGIGGSGMMGAARLLLDEGARVSGSDQNQFEGAGTLVSAGAVVRFGHAVGHVGGDVQLMVCSAAIPDDNPEIMAARAQNIPILRYAELLGQIMATRRGVAIAGTHGKSTTTGMTAHVFRCAGLSPSFIVGATSEQLGGSSDVGTGPHFIVESCEYARSFLNLCPHSAAILNVEADHLDCYRDLDDIVDAFGAFAGRVDPRGLLVVNHDDRAARRAARAARCEVQTCGFGPGADWRAVNLRARRGRFAVRLFHQGSPFAQVRLQLAGRHNVSNALSAAALAHHAGAPVEAIIEGLSTFEGVARRMSYRGTVRGVTVIDDYAHHPTEIRATLEAVRHCYAPKRTWAVFQPHQASRTRHLLEDFSRAFTHADVVVVPDIYSVRDTDADRMAVGSAALAERIAEFGQQSIHIASMEEVTRHLENHTSEGDVVVIMGAGDIGKVADELVERMC